MFDKKISGSGITFERNILNYRSPWLADEENFLQKSGKTYLKLRFEILKHPEAAVCRYYVFLKIGALKNFLCRSLFFKYFSGLPPSTLLKKRLRHKLFLSNHTKLLLIHFLYFLYQSAASEHLRTVQLLLGISP